MSIGLLCDYPEVDEIGIKLTAEESGIEVFYIPFRKISVEISAEGYKLKSKSSDYSEVIDRINVVLNRAQSKNRRLLAASILKAMDKNVINPLSIEFICFSKLRTLLSFLKSGVKTPKTVFIPCDSHEPTKDGGEVHNEKDIADILQHELGNGMIVIKPDAGTHGRGIKLAKNREELIRILEETRPSIINPVGVLAQEFVQKWFYDLRIIVFKEKRKMPYCHPKGMARAGFKDFRTNATLGNFVFGVDLPTYIRDVASKCGSAIGEKCETWLLALDAMIDFGEEKFADDNYVKEELEQLVTPFENFKKVKKDPMKKSNFSSWNRRLEAAFQNYMFSEAYENVKKIIEESIQENKYKVVFHEANSCPEFWEQTRLATGANLAEFLFKCAESIIS